ncbi:hypothetical protein L6R52_26945, partial [Myxococcota bacterium]|nr:hypothetical protein [Myxococcota bacterium]
MCASATLRLRTGLPWTLLLSACVSVDRLELPSLDGARSLIVTRDTGRAIAAEVVALDETRSWAWTFERDAALSLVALAEPLESLQLTEGALSFDVVTGARRTLPAPLGAWALDASAWVERDAPAALVALRLP